MTRQTNCTIQRSFYKRKYKMYQEEYKVSIVLPVYNGEKYLPRAIESILSVSYRNYELIIIDDCSTDKSNQIAKSYAEMDARIKVYRNRQNKKLPKSLNAGFRMAKGNLFTWTSDDNILRPEAIEEMVHIFEKKADVDFVYADVIPIDGYGNVKSKAYLNGEIEDIYVFNPIMACFLYKRKIHERLGGYDSKVFLSEDYDYWIRTYENGFKMYHLKEKLYYYRVHNSSLTTKKLREHAIISLKLLSKNLIKEKKMSNKMRIVSEMKNYVEILIN